MLNKFVQKKKLFLLVCAAVLLILWTLTLIFGNGEDKTMVLVLSLIMPFFVYGLVRLMFKIVRINAPLKFLKFGTYFFFIFGVFGVLMDVMYFITEFPNGLSPVLTAHFGIIIATLDEAKKNIDIEGKQ